MEYEDAIKFHQQYLDMLLEKIKDFCPEKSVYPLAKEQLDIVQNSFKKILNDRLNFFEKYAKENKINKNESNILLKFLITKNLIASLETCAENFNNMIDDLKNVG